MDILIEEAPQLIVSLCLIIASVLLLALRVASVVEGMPVLILVAGYWIGNGSARLASQQTLTNPASGVISPPVNTISPKPIILNTAPTTLHPAIVVPPTSTTDQPVL
jgi:hypothetical protein